MNSMTRSYKLKQRGEAQDRTRQKIVDAAVELHQSKGLIATSISDIAARAKVGRVTVYRHFPDEMALVGACSGLYFARNPMPDPEEWLSEADAVKRLRLGLRETYAYHRRTEAMMTRILADARDHPLVAPYHAHWQKAADILVEAWNMKGQQKKLLSAAILLAVSFDTWRNLIQEGGITDDQAVDLMVRLTCACPTK